jgi:hypothetical protein
MIKKRKPYKTYTREFKTEAVRLMRDYTDTNSEVDCSSENVDYSSYLPHKGFTDILSAPRMPHYGVRMYQKAATS